MKKGSVLAEIENINKLLEIAGKKTAEISYYNLNFGKGELREFKEKLESLIH